MTLFQWLSITFLIGLLLVELWEAYRGHAQRSVWWLRVGVWFATAAAIARPEWVGRMAKSLGIESGVNLVTYITVLLLMGTSLYFYSRFLRLQHQISVLTRRLAILEARRPGEPVPEEARSLP